MDDNLVAQNPRDSLIVMRNQNLSAERYEKIKNQAKKAETRYLSTFRLFSEQFLRSDAFDTLSELQKKELEKICVSFCKRRIFLNLLPFLGSLGGVLCLGYLDIRAFLLFIPWMIGSFLTLLGMEVHCEKKNKVFFFDQIDFLLSRRKIKKAERLKNTAQLIDRA